MILSFYQVAKILDMISYTDKVANNIDTKRLISQIEKSLSTFIKTYKDNHNNKNRSLIIQSNSIKLFTCITC